MNRHAIVEHIWRAMRASLLFSALVVWLLQDGFGGTDWLIVTLCLSAHLTEQFHGLICVWIEKLLGWDIDFDKFD